MLRLLAGSIIRQLLTYGIPADAFWTPHDIADASGSFPLASKQTPQWVVDFDAYVQKMVTQSSLPESVNSTIRAYEH